jgi:hypothetical protein
MTDPRQPRERVDPGSPGKYERAHGDGNVPRAQAGRGQLGHPVYLTKGERVDEKGDKDGCDALERSAYLRIVAER